MADDWTYPRPGAAKAPELETGDQAYVLGFRLASFWARLAATVIDYGLAFVATLIVDGGHLSTLRPWTTTVGMAIFLVNFVVLQGLTGRSIGKIPFGLYTVIVRQHPSGAERLTPPGLLWAALRLVGQMIDATILLTFLLPLIKHSTRRTIGDWVAGTFVMGDPSFVPVKMAGRHVWGGLDDDGRNGS